ncbi:MAG: tRNA 2-thiouridine(34) synthase MnmA [Desulfosalsimonadaceae bacterium]
MIPEIAVAISGGIDSLVAAYVLKKQYGNNIIGFHFLTGYEQTHTDHSLPPIIQSNSLDPLHNHASPRIFDPPYDHPVQRIANQLDIPIKLMDCRNAFQQKIVDYFVRSYQTGETPNPCMICNQMIKFGIVLDVVQIMGIPALATGHYARLIQKNGISHIHKGVDAIKDQSYFLAFLKPENLPFIRLPLGDLTKRQVIEFAASHKLTPVSAKESQDVCFIPNNDYAGFIASQPHFSAQPGQIIDSAGKVIGIHNGLYQFTIGQRRGINCPAAAPYYVIKIDTARNRLIIGFKEDVYKTECFINSINWFIPVPSSPLKIAAQIRYRHHPVEAMLFPSTKAGGSAVLRFKEPQAAVTPGQAAVCYMDDQVIAGGWIHE